MIDMDLYFQLIEWESIFEVIHYRGRVAFENGILFIIHTNEQGHNKPHLHVQYQDKEAVIEIPTGIVLRGNLRRDKEKQACEWVRQKSEFFQQHWNELTNGITFPIR